MLIPCPECEHKELEFSAQVIFLSRLDLKFLKSRKKLKKPKKSELLTDIPEDIRVFASCSVCGFMSENLNGFDEIQGYEEQVGEIIENVSRFY
ncbi:hypothetical protein [Paenibacillus glucanolyticus]|uniref:hypothetical protein n=1 Tax=Paenibacillus glucanolyticus TaxID=59843 RepID=UPI00096D9445|nr:hypothetical protein [Paenibacillus glucanolyticus]OMF76671.1 hypothetical protein BK142_14195 [Paenibacillus glucanolyticus]